MRKFPGYTFNLFMDEYAVRVYSLVADSMRMDAQEVLQDVMVVGVPHMKQDQSNSFIETIKRQAEDPTETLLSTTTESVTNKEKAKRIFGG